MSYQKVFAIISSIHNTYFTDTIEFIRDVPTLRSSGIISYNTTQMCIIGADMNWSEATIIFSTASSSDLTGSSIALMSVYGVK